jgi:hypothetical protein
LGPGSAFSFLISDFSFQVAGLFGNQAVLLFSRVAGSRQLAPGLNRFVGGQ